jgi:exopolysaccharide biosynthesis operon protein EpsL
MQIKTALRTPITPIAFAALAAVALGAQADELDTLQFRIGETIQRDSNVFRLSDSANTPAVPERGDTVAITTIGIRLNKPYGLQRFELEASAEKYNYQRFSYLNFTALNYAAAWRWSLTPAFHGNLTTDRQEYTDNAADVQNLGQPQRQVNRRTERSSLLDAEYELGAHWRVVAGLFERSSNNSQPGTFEPESKVNGTVIGARYVLREGDSLGYRFRNGSGNYTDASLPLVISRDFKDREHELSLEWQAAPKTTLQARLAYLERDHDGQPARDFSGYQGQLSANWQATAKITVAGGLVKELDSYQSGNDSYYDGYKVFIAPSYKPTEKTAVRLRYDHGVRNYKGAPAGAVPSGRRDTTNLATLGFEYQPLRSLTLTAALQRDQRSSNTPGFDYSSNSFLVSGLFSF